MTKNFLKNGDIVLVAFPFTNLKNSKLRPALVISTNIVNKFESDVTLAFISSVIPASPEDYEYVLKQSHKDFSISGLKKDSTFKLHKVTTVEQKLVKRRLGTIGKTLRKELKTVLTKALDL